MSDNRNVLRETDQQAIDLGRRLLGEAHHAAIATLDPRSGHPLASRVGLATDSDGTPLILVSALSSHTGALQNDPRCSLLVGEPGKGDPLAHPRLTIVCHARKIPRDTEEHALFAERYLAHNPKADLYLGLPDFNFFRLEVESGSLNAGFGKAYALTAEQVLLGEQAD